MLQTNIQNALNNSIATTSCNATPLILENLSVKNQIKNSKIIHSLTENGITRLLFNKNYTNFQGIMLTSTEETISITGHLLKTNHNQSNFDINNSQLSFANLPMTVSIIDNEIGQRFSIEDVDIKITSKKPSNNSVLLNNSQTMLKTIEINHPALKFQTSETLIGNRAAVEIRKYFGSSCLNRSTKNSLLHNDVKDKNNILYVGPMLINLTASTKVAPAFRRMSVHDGLETDIIEECNDFLV